MSRGRSLLTLGIRDGTNIYSGPKKKGRRHGYGKMTYGNGDVFVGMWSNGYRHGQGTLKRRDGTRYEGRFSHDRITGKFTKNFPDGKKYVGYMRNGQRHGEGVTTYPTRNRYEGHYRYDEREGEGVMFSSNGEKYDGLWMGSVKNGWIHSYLSCPCTPGGLPHIDCFIISCKGQYTFRDGRVYEGNYRNDQMIEGTMYNSDGSIHHRGLWKNGRPVGVDSRAPTVRRYARHHRRRQRRLRSRSVSTGGGFDSYRHQGSFSSRGYAPEQLPIAYPVGNLRVGRTAREDPGLNWGSTYTRHSSLSPHRQRRWL